MTRHSDGQGPRELAALVPRRGHQHHPPGAAGEAVCCGDPETDLHHLLHHTDHNHVVGQLPADWTHR